MEMLEELIAAALKGASEAVRRLVDGGTDVNSRDEDGRAALMEAANNGHLDVVKFLVDCGADVNAIAIFGLMALWFAASLFGYVDVAKFLVDCFADVNAIDRSGQTVLIHAAANGHMDVVKYLVESGADVKAVDNHGLMAVTVAATQGYRDIQRFLTQCASRAAMSRTDTNSTPTTNAISSSHSELLISPFDLNVKQTTDFDDNTGADFISTWLDADVALKLFVTDSANTTFYDEVTLWHQLRHPNVIKLYGACDVGHNLFVCELASNGSVVDYLKSCPRENRRPWKYLHHAALGLAYLHERGILHGDLRGSNILVGDDDQAKLTNFSLSGSSKSDRNRETGGSSRGFVGSARWQSPELLWGGKPSYASDVYALGLCIVEMLTGKIPWHDTNELHVHWDKPVWRPEYNYFWMQPAQVSGECQTLIKQLCCHNPTLRQSASACVRMFEDLAKQEEEEVSNNNEQTQTIPLRTPQHNVIENQYWQDKLATLWTTIQNLCKGEATTAGAAPAATTESYPYYQWIIDDLEPIYNTIQKTPQQLHLVEQVTNVLQDTVRLVQNAGQAALVIQLSSTRATGSSVYALRRRILALKRQLGIHQDQNQHQHQVQNGQSTDDGSDVSLRTPESQMFISEISKTWLILDEPKMSEERAAFLSRLYCEINEHGARYSVGQREIMQQAYDDLKSSLDANEDFATNIPVWFVSWCELTHGSGGQIQIGSGGFGSVYRAKWLDSDVVVKRLESPHLYGDSKDSSGWALIASSILSLNLQTNPNPITKTSQADERRMFEREVDIWFHLSHPHVVRLFGACHVGRQPFFVCEYASNGSLDQYLLQHPEEIWKKLHEAALGLLYLHERNVVHCDLKCNNIVVGSDKKAKVTDFGLSLATSIDDGHDDDAYKSGNVTGAWNWLSPELMLGHSKKPTRESDVFSFGMCIVEALRVVAAAQVEPEEREKLPPRVPWQKLPRKSVEYYMKRSQLPVHPIGCTDAQWELVEKMCKFNPSERIQMCTVVDELSTLAGAHQIEQPSQQLTSIPPQLDMSAVVSSVKNHMARERSIVADQGPRDKIYLVHELLWARIEDIHTRFNGRVDALTRLGLFAVDAKSREMAISAHSDSLIDFTELALEAYGLHRRLDKLMAAAFVRIDGDDATGTSVHDWKRKCYEFLGVDSSVAAQLLRVGDQSNREANAA